MVSCSVMVPEPDNTVKCSLLISTSHTRIYSLPQSQELVASFYVFMCDARYICVCFIANCGCKCERRQIRQYGIGIHTLTHTYIDSDARRSMFTHLYHVAGIRYNVGPPHTVTVAETETHSLLIVFGVRCSGTFGIWCHVWCSSIHVYSHHVK